MGGWVGGCMCWNATRASIASIACVPPPPATAMACLCRILQLHEACRGDSRKGLPLGIALSAQKCHLPVNTSLGGLMTYPAEPTPGAATALLDIAHGLRLDAVVQRVGGLDRVVNDWEAVLSGGEAQRVCIARALWHRPPFMVLDEATSQLDLATEKIVYEQLLATGAGIISVGHRPSLRQFHGLLLDMGAKVATMRPLEDDDPTCP